MSAEARKLLGDLAREQLSLSKGAIPALDEILLFALERKYLEIDRFDNLVLEQEGQLEKDPIVEALRTRVRLMKVDEICYQRSSTFHLSGVENVLSSMRECGHSLIFLVQGSPDGASVYVGLSQFDDTPKLPVSDAASVYAAAWQGNFPGSVIRSIKDEDIREISSGIGRSKHCGFLTGLPSLKRDEAGVDFVQGLERLIRTLRGRSYFWISVADPIPSGQIEAAIESCHRLTGDIHHLVKTSLTKAASKGKTLMAGMFGMLGTSDTDGAAASVTESMAKTLGVSETQQELETHERVAAGMNPSTGAASGAAVGAMIGSIVPGVGTAIGALVGGVAGAVLVPIAGSTVKSLGAAITGKAGHSSTVSDSVTNTQAFTNTVSRAVSEQLAGGGFGSFGMTWQRTTSVTQERLNRKAEFCEELLRKHEQRLMTGRATGMWTVGHYFCSDDADTYETGAGVLRSLFSGMDSQFEPPRITGLPGGATVLLRRFANIYLNFPNERLKALFPGAPPQGYLCASHPLGVIFNGVGTPLSTPELAIASPLPVQEIEGISVTRRTSFGVNAPLGSPDASLSLGHVLDHGEQTKQKLRIRLSNLPKHVGVFGLTGSGKSTTVQSLLRQLWEKHHLPFLIIEPAKAEYRRLASAGSMAGDLAVLTAGIESRSTCPLRINPFSFTPPDEDGGNGVHLLTHIDRIRAIFNASFPMYASMPYLLEEALLDIYLEKGWDLTTSQNRHVSRDSTALAEYFPTLGDLYHRIDSVVKRKGYWVEQERNLSAALKTRIGSLMAGAKGAMLNCRRSISDSALFESPVVIELRYLGDDDEKAFLMGLIVSRLYEYRESQSAPATSAGLRHLLVIEEAHRLLADVPAASAGMETANMKGKGVASFIDMLSEIRAYGQGVAVVDQVPGRLHPYIVKGTGTKIAHRLLARDDREMVGETMGLDDEQTIDLGLLDCGECIVHQDGVRKAFLCKVIPVKGAQTEVADFPNPGTREFRRNHVEPGNTRIESRGLHEQALRVCHDPLAKAMAAAVFSAPDGIVATFEEIADLLRPLSEEGDSASEFARVCWQQITDESWAFRQRDYGAFVRWREAGGLLIDAASSVGEVEDALDRYQNAAGAYFGASLTEVSHPSLTESVYEQLFARFEVLLGIAHQSATVQRDAGSTALDAIGAAIAGAMVELLPGRAFIPGTELVRSLALAIAGRISQRPAHRDELVRIAVASFTQSPN